jgi:hypothetical protein
MRFGLIFSSTFKIFNPVLRRVSFRVSRVTNATVSTVGVLVAGGCPAGVVVQSTMVVVVGGLLDLERCRYGLGDGADCL